VRIAGSFHEPPDALPALVVPPPGSSIVLWHRGLIRACGFVVQACEPHQRGSTKVIKNQIFIYNSQPFAFQAKTWVALVSSQWPVAVLFDRITGSTGFQFCVSQSIFVPGSAGVMRFQFRQQTVLLDPGLGTSGMTESRHSSNFGLSLPRKDVIRGWNPAISI